MTVEDEIELGNKASRAYSTYLADYIINKNGTDIREIIIKNYREKQRVTELINTAGWSLTRMLENISK